MKYIALALASTALAAAPLLAQSTSAPAPAGAASSDTMPQATTPGSAPAQGAAPASGAGVTVGAQVSDAQGGAVGTIESVSGGNAVLSTGTVKATLPLTAFAQGANGPVIGMTKADVEAAVAKAGGGAQAAAGSAGAGQTAASGPATITVGDQVSDTKGGAVGKVAAVTGDLVTVATANIKAQLPKNAFAQGANGLMIAMSASELEAAAKAAAPGK